MPPSLQKSIENFLPTAHAAEPSHVIQGRNVMAGYSRISALQVNAITSFIANDPLYIECKALMQERQLLTESRLINLFLILKYGLKNLEGNIIEFGSYRGGSAIFLAAAVRALGLSTTIYALDTFEGIPSSDPTLDFHDTRDFEHVSFQELLEYKEKWGLTNLVFVKGRFEETALPLLEQTQKIILAHIDCDLYESTKYAIDVTLPYLHPKGGYLVFDDALQSTCLGALQAVEEMVQQHQLRAEQSFPHLVYRYPKIG
ncbi:MAG: macrocin O-methyltransferase [Verrucomicrobia bacterium]|nr:macrocin O-methyltransferase [Verrucomicrobiota bacterium]